MDKEWKLLLDESKKFNINITPEQLDLFKKYLQILSEYNAHTNLISNTELENIINKHLIDSLSIGLLKDQLDWTANNNLIDIGIGGGFPGIPIIITNPNWNLYAVDSVAKKTKFIKLLSEQLGIEEQIKVITERSENLAHNINMREQFDIAVARAVSSLVTLAEYCLPFVKKGGVFVAYKAKDVKNELDKAQRAIEILGGTVERIVHYTLPGEEQIERNLVLIRKIKPSQAEYPRKPGVPKKHPLYYP